MRTEPTIHEVMSLDLDRIDPHRRYGQTGKAIPTTDAYRRIVSTLLRNGIRVERWILVNTRDQSVTFAITYNGIAGAHFDAARNTQFLSWDALRPRIEDYQYVAPDECPIAKPISRCQSAKRVRVA